MAARLFNSPQHIRRIPRSLSFKSPSLNHPFAITGDRNIILDTVKRGEDDHFGSKSRKEQTVILRFYEAFGGHGKIEIGVGAGLNIQGASVCDVSSYSCERDCSTYSLRLLSDADFGTRPLGFEAFEGRK